MRMYDIISKKKYGFELNEDEIRYFIDGFVKGEIPDYQMSALLMAIYFNGMSDKETLLLTQCMANSGEILDLSMIKGIKVDKHSTGGVGDKTTLVVAPVVAACGVLVAKMSGRGLGHTGGTIDKLQSIKGFSASIPKEKFVDNVKNIGLSIVGQTGDIAVADKKIYALRDVTATVDSIPLIASSVMSKKLAAGADCILLDVKTGSGAFMKSIESSIQLAKEMVNIGWGANKKCAALVTNMDVPLGSAVGNSLEVIEAVNTLKGKGPKDLYDCCMELSANLLNLAMDWDLDHCYKMAKNAINSGSAFKKLCEMVLAQGGDISVLEDLSKFEGAKIVFEVLSHCSGYISSMNTEEIGKASVMLGAGRVTKESTIDYTAGIILNKKTGDFVNENETLATFYASDMSLIEGAKKCFVEALSFSSIKPAVKPIIYAKVERDNVSYYN